MDNNKNRGFQYTYSAKEQAEIRNIRDKYTKTEDTEDKMERLRRLDARVTQKAQAIAIALGIIGSLILGLGMSLIMTDMGNILGKYTDFAIPIGIIIGVTGCVLLSLAYPIYNLILKRERMKIAPEILRLSDELMK